MGPATTLGSVGLVTVFEKSTPAAACLPTDRQRLRVAGPGMRQCECRNSSIRADVRDAGYLRTKTAHSSRRVRDVIATSSVESGVSVRGRAASHAIGRGP